MSCNKDCEHCPVETECNAQQGTLSCFGEYKEDVCSKDAFFDAQDCPVSDVCEIVCEAPYATIAVIAESNP